MKVCERCGEQLPDDALECTRCGNPVMSSGGRHYRTAGPGGPGGQRQMAQGRPMTQGRPMNGGQRPPMQNGGQRPPMQGGQRPPMQGQAGPRPVQNNGQRPMAGAMTQRPQAQNGQQGAPVQRPPMQGGQRPPMQGQGQGQAGPRPEQRPVEDPYMDQGYGYDETEYNDVSGDNYDEAFDAPAGKKGKKGKKEKAPKQPKQTKQPKPKKEKVVVDNSEYGREITFGEWFKFVIQFYIPVWGLIKGIMCFIGDTSKPKTMLNLGKAMFVAGIVAAVVYMLLVTVMGGILTTLMIGAFGY